MSDVTLTAARKAIAEAHADRVTWGDGTEYISVDDAARVVAAHVADERERIAQAIKDAFPILSDDDVQARCSAGHNCHAAARYTTGRLAARIARQGGDR